MNDEARWYAIYIRSRHEKQVHRAFLQRGVDSYLPLVDTIRQWADRKKKVSLPLFNSYVFVRINLRESLKVLTVDGVVRIVGSGSKPIPIPDEQIHAIRLILNEDYKTEDIPFFKQGESVEISAGPLRGLSGFLLRNSSKLRFVISVEMIGRSVAVEISPHILRKGNRIYSQHTKNKALGNLSL